MKTIIGCVVLPGADLKLQASEFVKYEENDIVRAGSIRNNEVSN